MKLRLFILFICLPLLLSGCFLRDAPQPAPSPPPSGNAPDGLRGVWLPFSDLDNLLRGQTPAGAAAALDGVMRTVADAGLNTVFLHVRANSDAYYPSAIYPPAETAAPLLAQGFDPLRAALDAARAHGLALHAWVNPYRVGANPDNARAAHFAWQGRYYYVPTDQEAQRLILDGIREIVDTYNVDGVHFDDYFYPEGGVPADAPADFEATAYTAYRDACGEAALSVADWRRAAVDALVSAACAATHRRTGCVFGVSPALDAARCRDELYADVTRWLAVSGYADYLCPQLYVGFENQAAPFDLLARRWNSYPRAPGVRLYAGLPLYKAGVTPDRYAGAGGLEWAEQHTVLASQVRFLRERGFPGFVLYRYACLDPAAPRQLESWTDDAGQTVTQQFNAETARAEIDALLREIGGNPP